MAELGETGDPKQLVPGEYSDLQGVVADLASYGDVLADAGAGLKAIDTASGWSGQAADQFHAVYHGQPARWTDAGDAFHAASKAVDTYAATLTWAQGQAADAIRQWDQAQAATTQAQNNQHSQPPGTPFHDPGEVGRAAARATLDRARQQLSTAGDTAAAIVDQATQKAPPEPSFWSKVGSGIEDAADTVAQAVVDGSKEAVNALASLGNAALHHPGQFGAALGGAALTAVSGVGEVGGGLLDLTGIGTVPGLGLGAASTAGIVAGVGIAGAATGAMAMEAAGEDHVEVFDTSTSEGGGPGEDPPFEAPKEISGRTEHGEERMQGRRGDGGVTDGAADDAVKNPTKPPQFRPDQYGGSYRYTGRDAVVNLNKDGEITSAWPRSSAGRRIPK